MKKLMMLLAMVAFAGALSAQTTTEKKPAEAPQKTEVKKSCSKSCCSGKTTATAEGKGSCCAPAATATAEKGRKGRKARRAKGATGTTTATAAAKPAATEPKASTSAVTPVKKTANKK